MAVPKSDQYVFFCRKPGDSRCMKIGLDNIPVPFATVQECQEIIVKEVTNESTQMKRSEGVPMCILDANGEWVWWEYVGGVENENIRRCDRLNTLQAVTERGNTTNRPVILTSPTKESNLTVQGDVVIDSGHAAATAVPLRVKGRDSNGRHFVVGDNAAEEKFMIGPYTAVSIVDFISLNLFRIGGQIRNYANKTPNIEFVYNEPGPDDTENPLGVMSFSDYSTNITTFMFDVNGIKTAAPGLVNGNAFWRLGPSLGGNLEVAVENVVFGIKTDKSDLAQDILTDGSPISWDLNGKEAAMVAIGGNRTFNLTNATGIKKKLLEVRHLNPGTTITLPGNSSRVTWNTGTYNGVTGDGITLLNVYFNGSTYVWYN